MDNHIGHKWLMQGTKHRMDSPVQILEPNLNPIEGKSV